jgi:hypothetical protein
MAQHGQVLKLRSCRSDGKARWAYRYRVNGSCSKRPQVGGFATREEAERALKRELARLRPGREMTLHELVEEYLRIHQAAPSTLEKLRWLLSKATTAFGDRPIAELRSEEICTWRGTDCRVQDLPQMPWHYSMRTRAIPPRGRQVDAAAEPASPLGDSRCSVVNQLTFGAVDVSWTSPLRNVSFTDNQSCC